MVDSSLSGPEEVNPAPPKKRLAPAASFADVLEDLAKKSGWLPFVCISNMV